MGTAPPDDTPGVPDIDGNGVDRAQIRAMLRLTPEARLRLVEEFLESAQEIRDLAVLPVLRATLDEVTRRS
jgi:hypothetical protein